MEAFVRADAREVGSSTLATSAAAPMPPPRCRQKIGKRDPIRGNERRVDSSPLPDEPLGPSQLLKVASHFWRQRSTRVVSGRDISYGSTSTFRWQAVRTASLQSSCNLFACLWRLSVGLPERSAPAGPALQPGVAAICKLARF